jgi:hypothetical protein
VIPPKVLRAGIAALQENRCFYCSGALGAAPEADHFVPRVRCGIDAVENLVLADRRCNNDKRDLLPGPPHVTAWARRNEHDRLALVALARASRPSRSPSCAHLMIMDTRPCLGVKGSPIQIRPSRPLRSRSEAISPVGEVASRSFDRTLTAGFGGILRHVAFTKSGERHILAERQ